MESVVFWVYVIVLNFILNFEEKKCIHKMKDLIIKVVTHECLTEACVFIHFNDDDLISIHSQQILALQVLTVIDRGSSVIQIRAGMTVAVRRLQMDMFAHAQGVSQASTVRPPLRLTASASLTDVNWTKPAP